MTEKCGTYAGWNVHMKAGEKSCDACREARKVYQAKWRAKGGPAVDRQADMHTARCAAVWRLKDLHRAEFDLLVQDEYRALRQAKT